MAEKLVVPKVEETVYTFKPVAKHGVDLNALDKKVDSFSALLFILHRLMQELRESSHATKRQEFLKKAAGKVSAHVSWKLALGLASEFVVPTLLNDERLSKLAGKHLPELARNHLPKLTSEVLTKVKEGITKATSEGLKTWHQRGLESAGIEYDWVRGEKEDAIADMRKLEGRIDDILRQLAAIIQQNVANFR